MKKQKGVLAFICFWILLVFFYVSLATPPFASAHLGSGPPFVTVNGTFAQTNPYYQGTITLAIPLDILPDTFIVNKPVTLAIDIPALQKQTFLPENFLKQVSFRWSYATGDNYDRANSEYRYGKQVTYTFSRQGSYLVTLEGKTPADQGYTIIDTIAVNVLPNASYHMPKVNVYVGDVTNITNPTLFLAQASFDPSVRTAHYLWDFNTGTLQRGITAKHAFAQDMQLKGLGLVYARVVDDHGLMTDVAFGLFPGSGTTPSFQPLGGAAVIHWYTPFHVTTNAKVQLMTQAAQKKTTQQAVHAGVSWYWYVIGVVVLLGILITIRILRTKAKSL